MTLTSHSSLLLTCALLILAALSPAHAQVQSGRELVRLNASQNLHEIAINTNVSTTVVFPEKITTLTGFGLVTQPQSAEQMGASKVCIVHYENSPADTLVVRLIKPGEACYATIRTARAFYMMRFTPSEAANLAVIVPPPAPTTASFQVEAQTIAQKRIKFSAEELVGMLGKARNRKALQPLNPGLYSGWQERNGLEMTSSQNGMISTIYEIQRNPDKDIMVFRCKVTNGSTSVYDFEPDAVKIRVGERSYDVQLADSGHTINAGGSILMDLVTQGGPGGNREALSINQDFRIEMPEPGRRDQIDPVLFGDSLAEGK
ncbi:hypothetical protein [Brevifollis gellanilyticus]|uniref:Conjugal transfer protein TraK n=1 Tax=Brevifollis gellanilyticus TaxID=748831 RepID=A0A512M5U6_9BACT|nr:hypothetical protein [Brevifollis gellanilyticus]GEP42097.1 hypothetical protein BGE01nite_13880 [Brevifollis gellanilyticus]